MEARSLSTRYLNLHIILFSCKSFFILKHHLWIKQHNIIHKCIMETFTFSLWRCSIPKKSTILTTIFPAPLSLSLQWSWSLPLVWSLQLYPTFFLKTGLQDKMIMSCTILLTILIVICSCRFEKTVDKLMFLVQIAGYFEFLLQAYRIYSFHFFDIHPQNEMYCFAMVRVRNTFQSHI